MCVCTALAKGGDHSAHDRKNEHLLEILARTFWQDTQGNIVMLFALMSTVLFLFIGGSVDYARYNAVRTDILESLDAASLAVARMENLHNDWTSDQLVAYGEDFFVENTNSEDALLKPDHTPYSSIGEVVSFDLVTDDTKVRACINGSIETHLLSVVNIRYLEIAQCVGITKAGSGRVEVALVLDMTGSMRSRVGGERKMTSLKKAVVAMLDELFGDETQSDSLKIGVVPFNYHVNAGGASSWVPSWGDLNAQSLYHGARFIHVDENGNVDVNTKVNHYRLYDSDPNANWTGCVESRPYPLDELDTPPGTATSTSILSAAMTSLTADDEPDTTMHAAFANMPSIDPSQSLAQLASSANSRFVPVFLGDDPNCNSGWNGRCPLSNGDSYWSQSEMIPINGANYAQSFARNWFSDPSRAPGINRIKYQQRDYIDDERFTGRFGGSVVGHYARVVEQFRALESPSGSYTPAQQAFRDYMIDLGVGNNRFTDPSVTSATDTSSLDYDEFILRGAYVGWWNPITQTYDHKYDLPKDDPTFAPNMPNCPPALLPLTDDRLAIDGGDANGDGLPDGGIVGALYTTGGTNIPNGAMWGWRVVSDGLPFTESTGPADTGPNGTAESDWQRAVVIMTDGENTFYDESTHFGSWATSYGYVTEERMGFGIDATDSGGTNGNMKDEADNKLLRICRRMKQEDILVYTIVFDVASGSNVDTRMKACATEPTEPYYFNAPTASALKDAFKNIAEDLTRLHVSQ